MMNNAQRLTEASQDVLAIDLPDGPALQIRYRRVDFTELAPATRLTLAGMAKGAAGPPAPPTSSGDVTGEMVDRLSAIALDYLCCGVVASSFDGVAWEPLSIVPDQARAEPGAGRLHPSALPPGSAQRLSAAIMAISTDVEVAARRLATFRGA